MTTSFVPIVRVRVEAQNSVPPLSLHDLLRESFTFYVHGFNHVTVNHETLYRKLLLYEGWNFNSGNYLFTTDTK